MQTSFPIERGVAKTDAGDAPIFNAAILYDDGPAGHRAMRTITSLTGTLRDQQLAMRTQLWRFDLLHDPEWFALALADAVNADMLIFSMSSAYGLPATVEKWLKLCIARKRGMRAAVIALLGPDDDLDEPGSPRFRLVQGTTKSAGLDFFAPGLKSREAAHPGSKANRFPTLAKEFPHTERVPRWGINE